MIRSLLLLPFLLLSATAGAQPLPPEQRALKAHVQFLASDAMRGREAGTPDFDIASEYVAAQMLAAGLKPAGVDGGWFQPMRIVGYKPAEKAKWTLRRGTVDVPIAFGVDFINGPVANAIDYAAEAPVVFAGYGIVYPEGKRDDYAGLDVKDKIVAILPGAPKGLPNEVTAHLGDSAQKAALARARGAKAVILVESAARLAQFPFAAIVPFWEFERTGWAGPSGEAHVTGAPVLGYFGQAGADKLFAGSRIKWADVIAAERSGARIPTGPLAVTLKASVKTVLRPRPTHNVVGLLEGSDPALRNQYVVVSAHLDHVGVGEAVKGDKIYNGAMDNAIGVATILEVARSLRAQGIKPRRSILFVALTAEEKGLLGSAYFATNPPVPQGGSLVANINLDMPILSYKIEDLVVQGAERSSIGPAVAKAAAAEGLKVVPDPAPEEMFFVRSDHYSFVQAGVPAVSIDTGPGGAGAAAQKKFLETDYHKPSDQIDLPFDWDSAAKYLRVSAAVTAALANDPARPSWNKGDFFGVQFEGYGAR